MLDEVDLQILQVLQTNSRISFSELGRSVGLSATAARNRINSLVSRGIIRKLGAELDWAKIGWPIQSILLIRTEHGKAEAVTKQLHKIPQILSITKTAGNIDLVVRFLAGGISDFTTFLHKSLSKIPGITSIDTLMVLEEVNNTPPLQFETG
ncbi:Lrp/AsnC family transcriptional regulator [Candidatus Bathyarchaeota archaeon]|nr:Lrp/AsnC family transcriptional regulator [Candidatus Bathyarchaeota archaeon]